MKQVWIFCTSFLSAYLSGEIILHVLIVVTTEPLESGGPARVDLQVHLGSPVPEKPQLGRLVPRVPTDHQVEPDLVNQHT